LKNNKKQNETTIEEVFEKEILQTIPRYVSHVTMDIDLDFKNSDGTKLDFAKEFAKQFEHWKLAKSPWDKRSLIYTILDKKIGEKLSLWQLIERYLDDRYAKKALEIGNAYLTEKEVRDPNYWASLAKVQIVLLKFQEAERSLATCLEIDPKHTKGRVHFANLLHLNQEEKQAHELYNEILKESQILNSKEEKILNFQDLVGRTGVLNSPIYAIAWLSQDKDAPTHIWNWAANEFYYSPYFRSNHAYFLIKKGDALEGFAKLLAVSQEMDWYKDAVLNAHSLIEQLNLSQTMEQERIRLEKIIVKNDWKAEE
jgi:hypothetical protein